MFGDSKGDEANRIAPPIPNVVRNKHVRELIDGRFYAKFTCWAVFSKVLSLSAFVISLFGVFADSTPSTITSLSLTVIVSVVYVLHLYAMCDSNRKLRRYLFGVNTYLNTTKETQRAEAWLVLLPVVGLGLAVWGLSISFLYPRTVAILAVASSSCNETLTSCAESMLSTSYLKLEVVEGMLRSDPLYATVLYFEPPDEADVKHADFNLQCFCHRSDEANLRHATAHLERNIRVLKLLKGQHIDPEMIPSDQYKEAIQQYEREIVDHWLKNSV